MSRFETFPSGPVCDCNFSTTEHRCMCDGIFSCIVCNFLLLGLNQTPMVPLNWTMHTTSTIIFGPIWNHSHNKSSTRSCGFQSCPCNTTVTKYYFTVINHNMPQTKPNTVIWTATSPAEQCIAMEKRTDCLSHSEETGQTNGVCFQQGFGALCC